jgi:hypothetical protein
VPPDEEWLEDSFRQINNWVNAREANIHVLDSMIDSFCTRRMQ